MRIAHGNLWRVPLPLDFLSGLLFLPSSAALEAPGAVVENETRYSPALDTVTGGFRKGELIVLGALPGAGKTALACQIIAANAEAGNAVGVFSLEMSRWDLGKRFLSTAASVSASKIRHPGHIRKEEWSMLATGAAKIADWPVRFDDSGSISIPELSAFRWCFCRSCAVRRRA